MLVREKPKNAKEAILSYLLNMHPLTPSVILRELEKNKMKITIQGVVKDLKTMEKDGIIVKEDEGFSISPEYIERLQQTYDLATSNYSFRGMKIKKVAKSVEIYTANSMLEQDKVWTKISFDWLKRDTNDKIKAWIGRHPWVPICRLEAEDKFQDMMASHGIKTFNLVTGNTPLDKASVKYYNDKEVKTKIIQRADIGNVYIESFGDSYIRCEFPEIIVQNLEKLFRKTKNLKDVNMKEVTDIMKMNVPITVLLIKDAEAAKKIRQDILRRFNRI